MKESLKTGLNIVIDNKQVEMIILNELSGCRLENIDITYNNNYWGFARSSLNTGEIQFGRSMKRNLLLVSEVSTIRFRNLKLITMSRIVLDIFTSYACLVLLEEHTVSRMVVHKNPSGISNLSAMYKKALSLSLFEGNSTNAIKFAACSVIWHEANHKIFKRNNYLSVLGNILGTAAIFPVLTFACITIFNQEFNYEALYPIWKMTALLLVAGNILGIFGEYPAVKSEVEIEKISKLMKAIEIY